MWTTPADCAELLRERHYLGPTARGLAWVDEGGVIVVAPPTTRRLPTTWLEVTRWCITDRSKNAGTQQWGRFVRAVRERFPEATTLVSYSDPSVGHDGALYRACNWWWAPTWLRLRPPPSGNGSWKAGQQQSVKDRWVFALRRDPRRLELLVATDESILKRWPWARYQEPGGADFKQWKEKHNACNSNTDPDAAGDGAGARGMGPQQHHRAAARHHG